MKIFKKEKEVAESAYHYLDAAEHCVTAAENAVLGYLTGDLENPQESQELVNRLEAEADALRRSIGDQLFSGAYLPLMRGDIFGLIESMDNVPNAAEACSTLIYAEQPVIPEEFKVAFVDITRESFGVIKPLKKVVRAFFKPKGKFEAIQEGSREIGQAESAVDELELELTKRLFKSSSTKMSSKLHLRKVLDHIVKVSDKAEDTTDQLVLIAMKSVT